jgi:hypothetical protein
MFLTMPLARYLPGLREDPRAPCREQFPVRCREAFPAPCRGAFLVRSREVFLAAFLEAPPAAGQAAHAATRRVWRPAAGRCSAGHCGRPPACPRGLCRSFCRRRRAARSAWKLSRRAWRPSRPAWRLSGWAWRPSRLAWKPFRPAWRAPPPCRRVLPWLCVTARMCRSRFRAKTGAREHRGGDGRTNDKSRWCAMCNWSQTRSHDPPNIMSLAVHVRLSLATPTHS